MNSTTRRVRLTRQLHLPSIPKTARTSSASLVSAQFAPAAKAGGLPAGATGPRDIQAPSPFGLESTRINSFKVSPSCTSTASHTDFYDCNVVCNFSRIRTSTPCSILDKFKISPSYRVAFIDFGEATQFEGPDAVLPRTHARPRLTTATASTRSHSLGWLFLDLDPPAAIPAAYRALVDDMTAANPQARPSARTALEALNEEHRAEWALLCFATLTHRENSAACPWVRRLSVLRFLRRIKFRADIPSLEMRSTDMKTKANLQWPLTIFSLAYGCTLLFGRMADIFGPRILFLLSGAWFSVWCIGTAFAPNLTTVTIFIAMLGLGAAANSAAGIGIIASHFPAGPRRNIAFGVLGASQPLGYILGLVLGGILSQSSATWRAIFYIPAGLGALLLIYSLAASASAPRGWATPYIIGLICASAVIMVIFWFYEVWRENNVKSVFVPPSIWKHPSARMPAMIAAVSFCLVQLQHSLYLCALYYQQINGLSPLQTSIRLLPAIGAGMTINLAGERLLSRVSGLAMILGTLTLNMVSSKSRILFLDVNSNGLLSGFTLCASSRPEFDEIPFEF
ncbi:major facilitator superfamily domain-containing protein [Mycena olivaceomarginata]|nr:major facilitator superfamily domain-containing protein [Mycena olivaceomarginata]